MAWNQSIVGTSWFQFFIRSFSHIIFPANTNSFMYLEGLGS